jgi:hypothetical protein
MNLANPSALLWAGLAFAIAVFYLLKVRLRRLPVSTNLFWQQVFEEKRHRALWRRLRHLVSLLVQWLMLALLILALADPYFPAAEQAPRLVCIVDNSASMNATDIAPTRLAAAREKCRQVLHGLRYGAEAALVTAGTEPQVVCGFTAQRRTLLQALEGVQGTDGPTRVAEAVAQARRLLAGSASGHIAVFTDGCFAEAKQLAESADVHLLAVGTPVGNVGISQLQVRRSLTDPAAYEVLIEVANCSDEPIECQLRLDRDNDIVDVWPLKLAARGEWRQIQQYVSVEGGRLSAHLDRPDALALDNQAWAVLPARKAWSVVLFTGSKGIGDLYVEKVLEANMLVQAPVAIQLVAGNAAPPAAPAGHLLVLHQTVPTQLPSGPLLVIDPQHSCDLWQLGDRLADPIVIQQEKDSLLLTNVRLEKQFLVGARKLTPRHPRTRVLATTLSGDPVFCAIDRPEGRVVVLTANLDQAELPLRTVFPILASNALAWLGGASDDVREAVAAGSVVELTPPPAAAGKEFYLWSPDGNGRKLPAERWTLGPLDQCGIWRIAEQSDGPAVQELACNLANRQESDLSGTLTTAAAAEGLVGGFFYRPVWFLLALGAWLLLVGEWYLYQRRWIS